MNKKQLSEMYEGKSSLEDEIIGVKIPKDCPCATCKFSADDVYIDGRIVLHGYTYGYCKKLEHKPYKVLYEKGPCPEYEKKEE